MKMTIVQLLKRLNATVSMSEGRRVAIMGAVKLNGFPVQRIDVAHEFHSGDVIHVGKREFKVDKEHLQETQGCSGPPQLSQS